MFTTLTDECQFPTAGQMIIFFYRNSKYEEMYACYSVKGLGHHSKDPLSIERIDLPLTKYLQDMLRDDHYKEILKEIR